MLSHMHAQASLTCQGLHQLYQMGWCKKFNNGTSDGVVLCTQNYDKAKDEQDRWTETMDAGGDVKQPKSGVELAQNPATL